MPIQFGLNEIHLWNLDVDVDDVALAALHATLCAAEQTQAQRFHFATDTRRFIARRGLVRATLANYTELTATALTFDVGQHGKPQLASTRMLDQLHFNYSYSGRALLLAVSATYEVGIDIEATQPIPEAAAIALQNFSLQEQHIMSRLNYTADAFFTCWTAKEAVIKALGSGLSRPLHDFTTLTEIGALQPELTVHDYDRDRPQGIQLRSVPASSFHHATLAALLRPDALEPMIFMQP